jgi:hypothetical protein
VDELLAVELHGEWIQDEEGASLYWEGVRMIATLIRASGTRIPEVGDDALTASRLMVVDEDEEQS